MTIRFRLTALATGIAALLLAATSLFVGYSQHQQALSAVDARLATRAAAITTDSPAQLDDDAFAQIVDSRGQVVVGSPQIAVTAEAGVSTAFVPWDDDEYRILSIENPQGTTVVGENLGESTERLASLAWALGIGTIVATAALCLLVWWLVGKTLEPVESIRRQVTDIGEKNLHERVPVASRDDEIARLAHTMNEMLDRIEASAIRQRRFVADASHELRSPITRMRTELETAPTDPATIVSAREELLELQDLVSDLLQLAQLDAPTNPPRDLIDLEDVLLEEAENARFEGALVRISHFQPVQILGNHHQIRRALRNLLDNGRTHASVIDLSLAGENGEIALIVTDNGPGIPGEHHKTVFDRFARLDEGRHRDEGGTGLGLAITKEIIEAHGGTIELDTGFREGARFVVRLPAADVHNETTPDLARQ